MAEKTLLSKTSACDIGNIAYFGRCLFPRPKIVLRILEELLRIL